MKLSLLPWLMLGCVALVPCSFAHEGHDDEAPLVVGADAPQRLPSGEVFLPKPTQRQLQVRTYVSQQSSVPRSYELAGTVVMDPNASGRVQSLLAGRVVAGPEGLPNLGQAVQAGDVLAYVEPSLSGAERMERQTQLLKLQSSYALAAKRVQRLRELQDTVARKTLEAAISEASALAAELRFLQSAKQQQDVLRAPVSGVIAYTNLVAGQVVEAGELLFEIVDPQRLQVEALAYELAWAQDISRGYLALDESSVPLQLIGSARSLRDQALPLRFSAQGQGLPALAVGQRVRVVVQSAKQVTGVVIPVGALVKNAAGQDCVWVKRGPERFEPHTVMFEVLDGAQVVVTSGLQTDDRVVVTGASLINQIR